MNRSDNQNCVRCSQKGKGIQSECIKHIGAVIYRVNYFKHKAILQRDSKRWTQFAFAFTQTAYLLKLVIPTTNALPLLRLNVETKTKRTPHSSRRLSFNELTKAKTLVLHSSHFAYFRTVLKQVLNEEHKFVSHDSDLNVTAEHQNLPLGTITRQFQPPPPHSQNISS